MSTTEPEIMEFPAPRAPGRPFDPPPVWQALLSTDPLVKVRLFDGKTAWLATRYADQRTILADPRISVDTTHPGYPHLSPHGGGSSLAFLRMDDPEHARLRRTVTPPFTFKRIEAMRPAVQRIVDGLVDDLLAGPKPVDLVEAFALPVPTLVISELLGVPYEDHQFFQENSNAIIKRTVTLEERTAAGRRLGEYLAQLVQRKLTEPADDLLSSLAERVKGGDLTHQEATQIGVLLLIGGHETTANMISLGTLALLVNPDQLALLRDGDPKLTASAVEELLRYLNITHNGMQRVALEDIEIAGHTISAGEGVLTLGEIANRDQDAFTGNVDKLDITREARHHLAFGYGAHHCLGQSLARLELQVVYSTLVKRIPELKLAVSLEEVPFKHDGFIYGVYELPVTW